MPLFALTRVAVVQAEQANEAAATKTAELQEVEARHSAAAADWAQQLQQAVQDISSDSTPALSTLQVLMAAATTGRAECIAHAVCLVCPVRLCQKPLLRQYAVCPPDDSFSLISRGVHPIAYRWSVFEFSSSLIRQLSMPSRTLAMAACQ